jgi:hypothetical protein
MLMVLGGVLLALTTVGPLRVPTDKAWYADTLIATDTLRIIYQLIGRELTGDFTLQTDVDSIDGAMKAKVRYWESNDYTHGWFNMTLIDSCVSKDSTLVEFTPKPCLYVLIEWIGFQSTGDSVRIWHKLNSIQNK